MAKKIILNLLKISVAAGLILWLVRNGKLDMGFVKDIFLQDPIRVFSAVVFIILDQFIVALRLRLILMTKAKEVISYIKLILINWIGLFFNSVLPGAVTGDLVKIFYIRDLDETLDKKFIFLGVFMDRLIGLIGLITVGSFFSLLNYNDLVALAPEVQQVVHTNLLMMLAIIIGLTLFLFFHEVPIKIMAKLKKFSFLNKIVSILEAIWNTFVAFKAKLLPLFLYSLAIQFIGVVIFWYLVHPFAEGAELTFAKTAALMPIGFISIAIPIAPAGLGVGHTVFDTLLGFYQVTNGANLFNLYFIIMMIANLTGSVPYIFYSGNKKVKLSELEQD